MNVWILILLGICAWIDVKKKEISLVLLGILGISGVLQLISDREYLIEYLIPLGFSVLFIGLSILSKNGIGMGDAMLLLALAMNMKMQTYLTTICLSFLLSGIWASGLMIFQKKDRKAEIPLVPFLLFGYVGGLALCL